ncbi:hypothetical protein ACFL0W_01125 [Nanoarchaeota archaeon]
MDWEKLIPDFLKRAKQKQLTDFEIEVIMPYELEKLVKDYKDRKNSRTAEYDRVLDSNLLVPLHGGYDTGEKVAEKAKELERMLVLYQNFERLLKQQGDSAVERYGAHKAKEYTEGVAYLTWDAQFKISGVTSLRQVWLPENIKEKLGSDFEGTVLIHHDTENIITGGRPEAYHKLESSVIALPQTLTTERSELRKQMIAVAQQKAINYAAGLGG